jgi:hypothetical protein
MHDTNFANFPFPFVCVFVFGGTFLARVSNILFSVHPSFSLQDIFLPSSLAFIICLI